MDYKLFSAILANRLKGFISEIIHSDQTGFVPKRYMEDNLRYILNAIDDITMENKKAEMIFLDPGKGFGNLDWSFVFKVLERMNC